MRILIDWVKLCKYCTLYPLSSKTEWMRAAWRLEKVISLRSLADIHASRPEKPSDDVWDWAQTVPLEKLSLAMTEKLFCALKKIFFQSILPQTISSCSEWVFSSRGSNVDRIYWSFVPQRTFASSDNAASNRRIRWKRCLSKWCQSTLLVHFLRLPPDQLRSLTKPHTLHRKSCRWNPGQMLFPRGDILEHLWFRHQYRVWVSKLHHMHQL